MAQPEDDSGRERAAASENELLASSDKFLSQLAEIDGLERKKRVKLPEDDERLTLAREIEDLTLGLVGLSRYQTRLVEMARQSLDMAVAEPRLPRVVMSEWRDAERTLRDARDAMERASDTADRLRDEHGRAMRHYETE